jgi:FMN reductase
MLPQTISDLQPLIVAIGGTTRPVSTSERILRCAVKRARESGAEVEVFAAPELDLPMYAPDRSYRPPQAAKLIAAMRRAHGVIVSSPGYHGSISGLVKNALDYAEDLREDSPPYWEGRAVGLIACAAGWQATGTTILAMRAVVHALRGWPTPMGVALNTCINPFSDTGDIADRAVNQQLTILVRQVISFARMRMVANSTYEGMSSAHLL